MIYDTLIKNAVILSDGTETKDSFVAIKKDLISKVGSGECDYKAASVINAEGFYLSSGFIDVHCHGARSHDFCDSSYEGLLEMAEHKLSEGVTTFFPTTLTVSNRNLIDCFRTAKKYEEDGQRFCRILGVHAEGPFINKKMLGAQNPEFVRSCDIEEIGGLNTIFPIKKLSYSIELDQNGIFTQKVLGMGIVPSAAHSMATYEEFLIHYENGLRNITHFCNQISPLHHRDIGLVGAGLLHDDVYIELIADRIHVSDMMLELIFDKKDNSKIILITDAMRASGMPDGKYSLGGLDVVVKDNAARLASNGALAGSVLKLNEAVKNIADVTGKPLKDIVACANKNPAESLGLENMGSVKEGFLADLVLFDKNVQVLKTFVGGELKYSL